MAFKLSQTTKNTKEKLVMTLIISGNIINSLCNFLPPASLFSHKLAFTHCPSASHPVCILRLLLDLYQQQHHPYHQTPNSTVYIITLINDGVNYLLVHCSESNEKHRQHIFPHGASIMSTSPIELNDDTAADPVLHCITSCQN